MPKKKKKKRKSKIQKRLELGSSVNSAGKKGFNEFSEEFIEYVSEDSDASSEAEINEEFESYYNICVSAWDISEQSGTYEKSIDRVKSLQMKKIDLPVRIYMRSLLVEALRMLFSLPLDGESVDQATLDILTSEELKYHNEDTD